VGTGILFFTIISKPAMGPTQPPIEGIPRSFSRW